MAELSVCILELKRHIPSSLYIAWLAWMKAKFSLFILLKASELVTVSHRVVVSIVLAGRSKGCRKDVVNTSEVRRSHLKVNPIGGTWRSPYFKISFLELLDVGEGLGSLHHREEWCVGGGEHVEEDHAGEEHQDKDQPGDPLSGLILGPLGNSFTSELIWISHCSEFLLRYSTQEDEDIEPIAEGSRLSPASSECEDVGQVEDHRDRQHQNDAGQPAVVGETSMSEIFRLPYYTYTANPPFRNPRNPFKSLPGNLMNILFL